MGFIPHEVEVDVTANVAIRVDAVEDLINRNTLLLSTRDQRRTATMGIELGNLADHRQRRWTLGKREDVEAVASGILHEFEKFGLPYLERFSDLGAMFEVLSRNDQSAWLHSPIHSARCERAVALGLVLGRRDAARAVADSCIAFLAERGDPGLRGFKESLTHLLEES